MSEKSKPVDPPISGIAAVQCLRSGHALAHVLNYVGENSAAQTSAWEAEFTQFLNEDGAATVRKLAQAIGGLEEREPKEEGAEAEAAHG